MLEVLKAQLATKAERSRRFGLLAAIAFGRFLVLYKSFNPDQPQDDLGRWTGAGAGGDVDATGSTTLTDNAARTGDLEIDSITEKLVQKFADVIDMIGGGSGPVYGTAVHSAFADTVRNSGIGGLDVEKSWIDGSMVATYGLEGSIRTDVVLWGFDYSRCIPELTVHKSIFLLSLCVKSLPFAAPGSLSAISR